MRESSTGPDMESDQSAELHLPPRPTRHSGDLEKAAHPSVKTEKDCIAKVRVLLEKQPWMSQYLKNADVTTVTSKTQSTDPESRGQERPGRQHGNDGTDNTAADDTDSSAECDIPIYHPTSPQAPQMANSPPAIAPHHPITPLCPPLPLILRIRLLFILILGGPPPLSQ